MEYPNPTSLRGDAFGRSGIALHTTLVFQNWTQKAGLRTVLRDPLYNSHPELETLLPEALETFMAQHIARRLPSLSGYTVYAEMDIFDLADDDDLSTPPIPRDLIRSEIYVLVQSPHHKAVGTLLASTGCKQGLFAAAEAFFKEYLRNHGHAEDCIALQHHVDSFLR